MTTPLAEQIACVEREIAMRERVYPTLIARQRMSKANADRETAQMKAVLATLLWLQAHEDKIKRRVEG